MIMEATRAKTNIGNPQGQRKARNGWRARGGEACAVSTDRNFGFFWCCDIHEKCRRVQGVEVRYQGKGEGLEVETQHITQDFKPQFISHGKSKFSLCSLNLSRAASEQEWITANYPLCASARMAREETERIESNICALN